MTTETIAYPVPANESGRVQALQDYDILDTLSEKEYDFITQIASQICDTPVSMITLIDKRRQWIKSAYGIELKETPREISFCNYTIMDAKKLNIVPDLREDSRYASNPLVTGAPNAVFYAGAPLVTPQGFVLGSICVLDAKVKILTEEQEAALEALARQTMVTLELRKKNTDLDTAQKKLKKTNADLKEFARIVSHDMKTPLANITMLSKGFRNNYKAVLDENADGYMELIQSSATELIGFIDRMLDRSEKIGEQDQQVKPADTYTIIKKVIRLLALPKDVEVNLQGTFPQLAIDETVLQQAIQNLVTNAIKYNDKQKVIINIFAGSNKHYDCIHVVDNGVGIAAENLGKIFLSNQTLDTEDRYGNRGSGIGLAAVRAIIEDTGGKIEVTSELKIGTEFKVCIPKQAFDSAA